VTILSLRPFEGYGLAEPVLKVESLYCERDERVLFEGLSFEIGAGEVLQIEGQNGSGKTTLLRILSGLSRNYEGELYWRGEPMAEVVDEYRQELLYFGHLPGVKATLTPQENLGWYTALHGTDTAAIDAALRQVGLTGYEDVPCHMLSAGQHRRVSLARLYLSQAPLWILDEPFTAIDKKGVVQKEQLILRHAASGGTVILTTHHELQLDGLRRLNLDQLAGTS
jgi:heme exporter protein A